MGLFVLQIFMVIALVRALQTMSTGAALAMFFAYAALMGVTLSSILLYYASGTIAMAFGVAAIVFVLMSVIGIVTKQDLTKWGPILLFGLNRLDSGNDSQHLFAKLHSGFNHHLHRHHPLHGLDCI